MFIFCAGNVEGVFLFVDFFRFQAPKTSNISSTPFYAKIHRVKMKNCVITTRSMISFCSHFEVFFAVDKVLVVLQATCFKNMRK